MKPFRFRAPDGKRYTTRDGNTVAQAYAALLPEMQRAVAAMHAELTPATAIAYLDVLQRVCREIVPDLPEATLQQLGMVRLNGLIGDWTAWQEKHMVIVPEIWRKKEK